MTSDRPQKYKQKWYTDQNIKLHWLLTHFYYCRVKAENEQKIQCIKFPCTAALKRQNKMPLISNLNFTTIFMYQHVYFDVHPKSNTGKIKLQCVWLDGPHMCVNWIQFMTHKAKTK